MTNEFRNAMLGFLAIIIGSGAVYYWMNTGSVSWFQNKEPQRFPSNESVLRAALIGKRLPFVAPNGRKKIVVVASMTSCSPCYREGLMFYKRAVDTITDVELCVLYEARGLRGATMRDGDISTLFTCLVDSTGWLRSVTGNPFAESFIILLDKHDICRELYTFSPKEQDKHTRFLSTFLKL